MRAVNHRLRYVADQGHFHFVWLRNLKLENIKDPQSFQSGQDKD